jgi:hypothetical protein
MQSFSSLFVVIYVSGKIFSRSRIESNEKSFWRTGKGLGWFKNFMETPELLASLSEDEMAVNFLSLAYLEEPSLRNGETPKEVEDLFPFPVIEGSCGSWRTIDETPDTQTSLVSRIYYWILILSAERLGPAGTWKLLEAVIVNRIPLVTLHPRRNPFDRTCNPADDHWTMCPAGSAALSFARIDKDDRSESPSCD